MSAQGGNTTSGNGPSAGATTAFRPTSPKHGGVEQVGPDTFAAWTGGKPMADWSGLVNPTPSTIAPNQYRGTSVASRAKSQAYRVMGMDTKFARNGNLLTFQKKVMKHFIQYGLDAITYLTDPTDPTNVVSVLEAHSRFNLARASKQANALMTAEFDSYDIENVSDAKDYLLNSITPDLEIQLYQNCKEDESFISFWLNLVHIVKSVSVNRFDKIKDRIKSRKIADYASENIEDLVTDYLTDWQELHDAEQYDPNLTLKMVSSIMEAANEDYRFQFRSIKEELNKKLLDVNHLDYGKAHMEMVKDNLNVQSILKKAKQGYRDMLDDGKWPAAENATDSKAMNKNYGKVNMTSENLLEKAMHKLTEAMTKSNDYKKKGFRREKGKGKEDKSKGDRKPNSRNKSARNNPGKKNSSPIYQPPKPGTGEIKFFDETKRYWCGHCKRWTLTHGTDSHKGKEELKNGSETKSAGMARVSFDLHPSAFMTCGPVPKSNASWINKILKMLLIVSFGVHMWAFCEWNTIRTLIEPMINMGSGCATILSKLLHPLYSTVSSIVLGVLSNIAYELYTSMSWIWVITTVMSGGIGFGTAAYIYKMCPNPKTRYRSGTNFQKRVMRATKPKHAGRLSRSRRSRVSPLKPSMVAPNAKHDTRFANISRTNRYEKPSRVAIVKLKLEIAGLEQKINHYEAQLKLWKRELSAKKSKLTHLENKNGFASNKHRRMASGT